MELVLYYTILLVLLPIILIIKLRPNQAQSNLPPGPKQWPIIGNFHLLGPTPLESLARLAETYGPVMTLKLGNITTMVISSSEAAREMFLHQDLALSGRHPIAAGEVGGHHHHSMMWLPVGPTWRTLRKVSTMQFFTSRRIDAGEGIRVSKVGELVEYATQCCHQGKALDVKEVMFVTLINIMSRTLFSVDLAQFGSRSGLRECLVENCELAGEPNLGDVFPVLKWYDVQGLGKKCGDSFDKVVGIFDEIVQQRVEENGDGFYKGDVLDTLLKLVNDGDLELHTLKHYFFDIVSAAVDTTSSTIKWAMIELIRHPNNLSKAQSEVDQAIHSNNASIYHLNTTDLPYMHSVIQETLRLHPPAPLLLPRKAMETVQLCGYTIPKDAQIWVNVWSIGRDPKVWSEPDRFMPERFMVTDENESKSSRDFRFLPFGEGRRMCPGIPLAYKIMPMILANLVYRFNWKVDDGVNIDDVCVEGMTFQRAQPFLIVPLPR